VLDSHDLPDDGPVRSLEQLEQLIGAVVEMRLNSEYTRLVSVLPGLLAELNRALSLYRGQRQTVAAQLLAQAYRAADAIADKFGYFDLSARIITLMQSAAFASGDELVIAAASYVRAETSFTSDNLEAGRRMLELAAERLMPGSSTDSAAAYGALHMRAAVIAARAGYAARAHEHIDEADCIACRVPEKIYYGTTFGSASVRIHRVTLAVDLADADAALRFTDEWVPPLEIPAERRSHYFVDLGRAHLQAGQYDRAIGALRAARDIAPQHIRVHPDVRQALFALREIGVIGTAELLN
jgi:tetratricopeptide (TPR) repeat protein